MNQVDDDDVAVNDDLTAAAAFAFDTGTQLIIARSIDRSVDQAV